ncbi:MAG: FAD-dependent oxidoreductase [Acidobacteriales bacterium]|nr:FAD-dependent oxidoreductase [Terriglobales bacterium]
MLNAIGGSACMQAAQASNTGRSGQAKRGTYRLTRDIPVEDEYDLLIAGGGPAGAAAAIAAGRLGAKVLLVESTGCMGGMATSGMMMSFCPVADGERCLTGGLMLEWIEALHKRGFLKPGIKPDTWRKRYGGWIPFNAEGLKLLLDELAVSAGVETRFFTDLIDADADARTGQVHGAIIHNIEGYRYVKARAFIDGTGNGVLAKLCGATCRDAGKDTPGIMPPTLISLFAGIDWARMGDQQAAMKKALADNFFTQPDRHFPGMQQIGNRIGLLNGGHIFNLDALREKSMTDGMMKGRRLAQEYMAFYRKYVPGCENVEHVTTAPLMGLRESRCVLGEYELGLADYHARRKFPDQIGVYNYPIDIHVYDTSDAQYARYSKEFRETGRMKPGESVGLPYGMIVARNFKNLWVAGRCASMDVQVHGAFRVQPAAVLMGQAAGTAAAQSVRTHKPAAEIDTEILISTLRKAGAYLPQTHTSKRMTRKTG